MKRIPIISRMIMVLSVFIFAGNMQAQTIRTNANGFPVRIHQKDAYTGSRTKSDNQLLREQRYMFLSEKYSGEGLSGDVISGNGVLVADLSPVHQSGPEIYAIIDNMEIPVEYTTYLPPNLHDYASVFVCLGMFPENYILSDPEGEMLKAYLLSGGNVMMEGGDTWYWDYPTPVHPLFNIQGIEEAFWYDIRDVAGQPGTLTDGMLFAYQNGNYMWGPDFDEIEAITPALDIFFHSDPPFGCGVSFDAGAYRTVGLAFEIGGLAELYGTTKDQLVASILSFFGPGFTPGLIEDFETGDFSKFPWLLGGLSPWTIDTSAPYEGMYAARSGQTTGNGFSLLSLMLQVDQPGEISFWLKVSSEPMYDFLRFSIDNVLISEWSGETGWIQAAFPVEPGNHLFTWSYEKDFSVNLGEDCARLDFIIFPGSSPNLVADFMAEPTMVCEGEPVHFFDQSVGNITSWQWEFPGGIPEISAEQYPMVHYPTFGVYDVTLTVSDGYNVATLTKPGYITVEHCTYSDILIADLDNNHNSGPVIMNAIGNLGLSAEYKVTIPNDLASYSSVFLCLGTWPENHILSNAEADMLVNFVTSGGNLYMEGADTWFFDPQTPLHPLFHIMPVSDGTYDPELELIMGQPGTFTESMSFLYDGDDIWVDHIQPMGPSFLVLENTGFSPFGCAVALDAGMYKTVGASAEIGGMAFGSTPVEELVHHILEFFGSGGGGGDNIEDFETGDFSKFPWQFGGSGGWHIETADPFEGVYCAASDSIGGNPAGGIEFADLFIQMTVEQPDVISFFRRISSEPNYDKLIFLIDEIEIAQWSGEIPWMPEEFPVEPGVHVFTWRYEKDFSVSMGQDRAWVDYITLPGGGTPPPPPPVDEDFETGDFSKFPWEFAGNEPWIIDSTMPFAGQFCARSGMIPDNSSSSLMISLNILQPGEISFFRKVSSENNYDQLIFSIDNQQVATWSGEMEWGFEAFPVPPGVHTFRWDYLKDNVIAWGADAAFIDDITFPPFENPCPPVVAMFEYAVNPVNAFVYSFTSTSTGPVSEWFWDFGDGTTSTLENPEHQFPGPGIFHVCLTVISSCNGQVDTWCEEIVVDDPCPPCIAHFSYIIDPADPFTVWFNDESQGNLATWFWDFGDGTTSPDQFPVHTYAAQGTYFVCLTVTSACSYCCDTWCDSVVIDASGYFNLGGTVYAGNFPIDEGFAYLYRVENGQIIDVFASFIHEYGYYDFFQLEEGTYILKAELSPNSPLYNLYIPTYYVSVPNWINASVINLQSNIWNADVHMIPISGASPGSGTIAGEIHKDGSGMPESFPVQHVEILLMDAQGQMLSCEYTDTHGSFIFPELAYGTYTVMAEVTGKYSSPAYVTIDEDHPSVTDILFIITGNEITLATGEGLSATGDWVGRIFPNPASDMVMIEIAPVRAENVSFVLVDQRGQTAMESIRDCGSGNQVVALDVSGLKAGLYTLVIRDDRGALSVRKVVKQ